MSGGVPVVDFARSLGRPCDDDAIVAAVGAALEHWGFVAIVGHGIDDELLNRAYAAAAELFALPTSTKQRYETPQDGRQRGYTSFGVEHAKDQPAGDLKEFWHVGRSLPAAHPDAAGLPQNQFPIEQPAFESLALALFGQMEHFADELLAVIARHLGFPADWFVEKTLHGNSVLRVIHYPPVGDAPPGAVRAAQHEDINLLTVLPVSTAPGLELLTRDGRWMPVLPPAGAVLCDTGDMMHLLTGGRLPATTHRVVNPETDVHSPRFSMPFFMHPRSSCRLDPIDGSPGGRTAAEFLAQRLAETGVG